MELEQKTSMRIVKLMGNLRKHIKQQNISFSDFIQNIHLLNPNYINQLELTKIIEKSNSHFDSMNTYELYSELKGNEQTIKVSKFFEIYSSVDKMYQHQERNQGHLEDKYKTRQVEKKMFRLGLLKLERYAKENDIEVLFQQCDVNGNGKLNKLEFNKFLIATDIKQLSDMNIRKVLIKKIFSYYPTGQMPKKDFLTFFIIKPEDIQKLRQQKQNEKKLKKNQPYESGKNKTFGLIKKKEDKENQLMQTQAISEQIIDVGSMFPQAMGLYRLGIPHPSQLQYFQKLQGYLEEKKKFVDQKNPKSNLGQYFQARNIFNGSYHIFQMAPSVLNREKSRFGLARQIQPKDIIQGEVGDCYFLSSISSIIASYPEVVADKILFSSNQAGYNVVKLFIDGQWVRIQTDDQFPCRYGRPVYAKPHGRQIWVMLLEKCWAKVFGSYESIDSGTPTEGFRALTGAPSQYVLAQTEQTQNKIYQKLKQGHEKRYVMTASSSTYLNSLNQLEQDKIGLISGHAYSFLKFLKIQGQTVVKLRNPWGKTIWKGQWSFESKKWTKQLRDRYNYNFQPYDGSFYIPWNQFIKYFSSFVFCKINPTYSHSSYGSVIKPHHSTYVRMIVREQGTYNIALYQQSKRKNKKFPGYEYSGVRIIVMKISEGKWEYIKSINKQSHCVYFQTFLKRGVYMVSVKVQWENKPQKYCCLTTYGPDKVLYEKEDRTIAPLFKKSLIQSYSQKVQGKVKKYDKLQIPQAINESSFSIDSGIGYMKVKNPSSQWFATTVTMKSVKGVKIIKPDKLPFRFDMQPKTEKVIGFFVNYAGYSYESSESMQIKY